MNNVIYITSGIISLITFVVGMYLGATNQSVQHLFERTATSSSAYLDTYPSLDEAIPANEIPSGVGIPLPVVEDSGREQELMTLPWRSYENTRYKYAIEYPRTARIQKAQEEERENTDESAYLDMGTPGITGTTSIAIGISVRPLAQEQTIESVAEKARATEATDINQNLPDKTVGPMEEILFANQPALAFTVYKTCCRGGMGGDVRQVFFTQTIEGMRYSYAIEYALSGSLVEEVMDSFKLTP